MSDTLTTSTLDAPAAKALKQFRGLPVVDVDTHAHETPSALAPYCEMPWRKTLEYLSTVPHRYLDIPNFAPANEPWPSWPQGIVSRRSEVTSAALMRHDLDELGVRVAVLFPDNFLLHALIRKADYAVAIARAYNRWLVEEWLDEDRGLKGAIIAPHHDPTAAAREVRNYAKHPNVVGVYLPTAGVEPLYGHRQYDPVFSAAQDAGLPVFLHSVTVLAPAFPFNLQGFETGMAAHVVSHTFSMIANMLSMIETGVLVRFPELRVVFTEGGIGWVPWIMMKIDREHSELRRQIPFYTERPSRYMRRQMFFATQPLEEPEHMQHLASLISIGEIEENVMFASDWPHHDFDHPTKLLQLPVSEELRQNIMSGNAARLLRLDLPR